MKLILQIALVFFAFSGIDNIHCTICTFVEFNFWYRLLFYGIDKKNIAWLPFLSISFFFVWYNFFLVIFCFSCYLFHRHNFFYLFFVFFAIFFIDIIIFCLIKFFLFIFCVFCYFFYGYHYFLFDIIFSIYFLRFLLSFLSKQKIMISIKKITKNAKNK